MKRYGNYGKNTQPGNRARGIYGHMAHFHFDGETEMETEKYERLKEENR